MKTGVVLYSSILRWNATRLLAQMADTYGDTELSTRMAKVRKTSSFGEHTHGHWRGAWGLRQGGVSWPREGRPVAC